MIHDIDTCTVLISFKKLSIYRIAVVSNHIHVGGLYNLELNTGINIRNIYSSASGAGATRASAAHKQQQHVCCSSNNSNIPSTLRPRAGQPVTTTAVTSRVLVCHVSPPRSRGHAEVPRLLGNRALAPGMEYLNEILMKPIDYQL